jgi:hypothetical protein
MNPTHADTNASIAHLSCCHCVRVINSGFYFGIAPAAIIFLCFFICKVLYMQSLRGPVLLKATADDYEGWKACSICVHGQRLVLILAWAHEGEKMRFYVQSADIHFTTHV